MKKRGRPFGSKHGPEALAKISQANRERWKDPEYRARHLPRLNAIRPPRVRPPLGTPECRLYDKIARYAGPAAARSLNLKGTAP